MSKVVSNVRPPSLRTDEDLVQLVLELHYRSLTYGAKQQHDAASEAVTELKRRLGQRDVALKLAQSWLEALYFLPPDSPGKPYTGTAYRKCANELRAIFEPKE